MADEEESNITLTSQVKPEGFDSGFHSSASTPCSASTPYQINPGLTKSKAKELYILHHWKPVELSEKLGIPSSTLNSWINEPSENTLSWKHEKEHFEGSVFAAMKEQCAESLTKTGARGLNIMAKNLMRADMEDMKLNSPREFKDMMAVIKDIKHLINLEEGKPTEIKQTFQVNAKNARKLFEELQDLDPFIDYDPSSQIN